MVWLVMARGRARRVVRGERERARPSVRSSILLSSLPAHISLGSTSRMISHLGRDDLLVVREQRAVRLEHARAVAARGVAALGGARWHAARQERADLGGLVLGLRARRTREAVRVAAVLLDLVPASRRRKKKRSSACRNDATCAMEDWTHPYHEEAKKNGPPQPRPSRRHVVARVV